MKSPPVYAPALIKLLQGPVYSSALKIWDMIFRHRSSIEEYFSQLGLELLVAEHDGLAFLRKRRAENTDTDAENELPELVARRELSYTASMLCVLLVEELYRFESAGGDQARLVLDREKIQGMIAPFLPAGTNEAKQADFVEGQINNLVRYGFLRRLGDGSNEIEVTRLLKYKIDAAKMTEIKNKLIEYGKEQNP